MAGNKKSLNNIQGLNGIVPLAYLGVNPSTPPQSVAYPRDPTTKDARGYMLLTLWLNTVTQIPWVLVKIYQGIYTWIQFGGGGGGGNGCSILSSITVIDDAANAPVIASGLTPLYVFPFGGPSGAIPISPFTMPQDGILKNMYVTVTSSILSVATLFTLYVNGNPTALTINVPGATTGVFSNLINQINITQGDVIYWVSSAPTGIIRGSIAIVFCGTGSGGGGSGKSELSTIFGPGIDGGVISNAGPGATGYMAPWTLQPNTTQTVPQLTMRETGSVEDLYVRVVTNNSTAPVTFTLNINSVNTALRVTVPALTAGTFSESVTIIPISPGDELQFECPPATAGSIYGNIGITFVG